MLVPRLGNIEQQWCAWQSCKEEATATDAEERVLEWLSQSADLNATEILRTDLKQTVHLMGPLNIVEIKLFHKEK